MYGAKEIMKITGYGRKKSYDIIHMVQDKMKKDYPEIIIIGAKIPIKYFEKYVLLENTQQKEGE